MKQRKMFTVKLIMMSIISVIMMGLMKRQLDPDIEWTRARIFEENCLWERTENNQESEKMYVELSFGAFSAVGNWIKE